jgi:excisionase family DNA binding protein|tara:strand:- start:21 stop:257 length:237 start_codon:yes stop_codon:yes gene_type:complete
MEELDIHVHSISEQLNRIEEKIDNRLNKTWLSITDVTKVVGISRSSINRAISLGQLKSVKSGGKRMIRKEWVDKWLVG